MSPDPRTPVLIGVGVAHDADVEASALMALAARDAAADAVPDRRRAVALLAAVDRIAVPQGTFAYPDPARLVGRAIGAPGARTHLAQLGVPQQTLVNAALAAVAAGTSTVALVVGGEARARARRLARAGSTGPAETPQSGVPDVTEERDPDFMAPAEVAAGLTVPVQQYAMIDNALRHADGLTLDAQRAEIARLWSRMNRVAATNPHAAFPAPMDAGAIATAGPDNYPLAFPYNKWHASQWTVDQAAALLICTLGEARRLGVPPDRVVFPLVALDASHGVTLSMRRDLHRWPAMEVLGRRAAAHVGRPLAEVEVAEVYSCFPAAVRVQQRALGLPRSGTPTVTGGMAFAGGPFNNFTYQATQRVVGRLRADPGAVGLVTTVCGLLTKPGLALWSATPADRAPLITDLADKAAAATPTVAVAEDHRGPATVATYTVTYDTDGPAVVKILGDTVDGRRCVAVAEDRDLAVEAVEHELIGRGVQVEGVTFTA
jgi:acetyl-CoA C-acetyltransferase